MIVYEYMSPPSTSAAGTSVTIPATDVTQNLECSSSGDANYAASTSMIVPISFSPAQTPLFSLHVGRLHASAQYVSIADSSPGVTIYYTTDDSTPSTSSSQYTAPIYITTTTTLKAIASGLSNLPSPVSEAVYTLTDPPALSVPGGTAAAHANHCAVSPSTSAADLCTHDRRNRSWKEVDTVHESHHRCGHRNDQCDRAGAGRPLQPGGDSHLHAATRCLEHYAHGLKRRAPMRTIQLRLTATVTDDQPTGSVGFSANTSCTLGAFRDCGRGDAADLFRHRRNIHRDRGIFRQRRQRCQHVNHAHHHHRCAQLRGRRQSNLADHQPRPVGELYHLRDTGGRLHRDGEV